MKYLYTPAQFLKTIASCLVFIFVVGFSSNGNAQCTTYKVQRTSICSEVNFDSATCKSTKDIYLAGIDRPFAIIAVSEVTGKILFRMTYYRPDGKKYADFKTDTVQGACGFYWYFFTPGIISSAPEHLGDWKVDFEVSFNGEPFKSVGTEKFTVGRKATCIGIEVVETHVCLSGNLDTLANCKTPTNSYLAGKDAPEAVFKYWEFSGKVLLRFS